MDLSYVYSSPQPFFSWYHSFPIKDEEANGDSWLSNIGQKETVIPLTISLIYMLTYMLFIFLFPLRTTVTVYYAIYSPIFEEQ